VLSNNSTKKWRVRGREKAGTAKGSESNFFIKGRLQRKESGATRGPDLFEESRSGVGTAKLEKAETTGTMSSKTSSAKKADVNDLKKPRGRIHTEKRTAWWVLS